MALRFPGCIVAGGGISVYNEEQPQPGPFILFTMSTKRLSIPSEAPQLGM
jgi:hypothetical protein